MWRSISSKSHFTRNMGKKLFSLQNASSYSSQSQVLNPNCFSSSSYCSNFLIKEKPRKITYGNVRFSSHSSSISEFESENHDPASSENEVESDALDGNLSQDLNFREDFDDNDEKKGAQKSDFKLSDDLGIGFDENVENNDVQIGDVGEINEELVETINSDEAIDVEKLEGVLSLLSTMDGSFESSLDDLKLSLNEEFILRVTETPLVSGESLIRFFKWVSHKVGVEIITAKILGSLARVISDTPKKKNAYALWDLVRAVRGESGVLNVELLNQLISVFSKLGKGKAAFEVFNKFDELGCIPNVDTYYLTIEILCKREFYDWAATVSQKMLDNGIIPDSDKIGNIISFYCKGYRAKEAYAVFLAAKEKNKYPPQRAVNFLISCLSKVGETVPLAKEMLDDFSGETRKNAINPFSWVIRGLCRVKDIEGGKKLLYEMIEKRPPPGNNVFNIVITALSKSGEMADAKEMVKLMESRGLKPDVFTYNVIISGYAKEGFLEEACLILAEARKKHNKLCPATFHTLIRGYCKLEQFDKAVKLLSDMKKYGVEPNVDEYNKLIQSLCLKALDWETSEKLLEEMTTKGMNLPGITRGLINAVKELKLEAAAPKEDVATL